MVWGERNRRRENRKLIYSLDKVLWWFKLGDLWLERRGDGFKKGCFIRFEKIEEKEVEDIEEVFRVSFCVIKRRIKWVRKGLLDLFGFGYLR